jgi:hypothetical protein
MKDITKLHNMVWVFHEAIDKPEEIVDFYDNNKE